MKYIAIILAFSIVLVQCKSSSKPSGTKDSAEKATAELTGTYWKLVELNGKPVVVTDQFTHEPYFILQSSDSTIKGNGGCNGFGGRYEWKAPNRIKISRIISTMMACQQIAVENELFKTLQSSDNYYIVHDTLSLNRAKMATLAKFSAVYLK